MAHFHVTFQFSLAGSMASQICVFEHAVAFTKPAVYLYKFFSTHQVIFTNNGEGKLWLDRQVHGFRWTFPTYFRFLCSLSTSIVHSVSCLFVWKWYFALLARCHSKVPNKRSQISTKKIQIFNMLFQWDLHMPISSDIHTKHGGLSTWINVMASLHFVTVLLSMAQVFWVLK